ncbi:hypothetical protein V6N11_065243 [Hibiscus sabdariffa]|uniref:RNase H type-1 domain-containing protein n=1 Tax=Hibiscus sabdariffa TaxID=183260 RepID=A0ABR2QGD5_9ROSI
MQETSLFSVHKSIAFIQSHYAELEALNNLPNTHLVVHHGEWSPPAANIIKLNFDAHFNYALHRSISGVIARNSLGRIMVVCAYPHISVADPFITEAKACETTVSFAIDLGFRQIQVEATHELARVDGQSTLPRYWFGTVLAVVEQAVQRDLDP